MPLYIRGKVLIRNREPRGRNKIEDVWKVVPYRIIDRIDPEGNVYSIQLVDGSGPVKNVHRRQILDMGQALDLAVESAEKGVKMVLLMIIQGTLRGTSPVINSDSSLESDSELIFKVPTRTYMRAETEASTNRGKQRSGRQSQHTGG